MRGLLGWLRRLIFGDEPPSPKCNDSFCLNVSDPRCAGHLCADHCNRTVGCGGRCIRVDHWESLLVHFRKLGHAEAFVLSNGDGAVYACLACGLRMSMGPGEGWAADVVNSLDSCDLLLCKNVMKE